MHFVISLQHNSFRYSPAYKRIKKRYLAAVILLLSYPFSTLAQNAIGNARAIIKIDIERTIGEIDPKIYGVFMEPIHFKGSKDGFARFGEFQYALWESI